MRSPALLLALLFAISASAATVTRDLPETIRTSESSFEATLTITITGDTPSGLVLSEQLPAGWTISAATWAGSSFAPVEIGGTYKWLFGSPGGPVVAAGVLTYTINPGAPAIDDYSFSGAAKYFDGIEAEATSDTTGDTTLAVIAPTLIVVESDGSTVVAESASTDSFTVVLDAQPSSDVVLTVTSSDTGEATVSPGTLTFTPANWDSAQTVTVTGVDDAFDDGDQVSTVTIAVEDEASDDAFDPVSDASVTVTTSDDDTAGITVAESDSVTAVAESASTDSFTVVLDAQPSSDVVLTITSSDTGEATVSPGTLTFTSANWDSAQTVTVTGVDDAFDDGDQASTVTIAVEDEASDDAFDPVSDASVTVTTSDDDTAGITVAESDSVTAVAESASTDSFTVVLTARPSSDVVLTITSSDTGEATVYPGTLTFTSANWDNPQTVTVTGVDDPHVDGDQVSTVTVAVDDAASDDAFDAVADAGVTVTTRDDDGFHPYDIDQDWDLANAEFATLKADWEAASLVLPSGATDADFYLLWSLELNRASGYFYDGGETSYRVWQPQE